MNIYLAIGIIGIIILLYTCDLLLFLPMVCVVGILGALWLTELVSSSEAYTGGYELQEKYKINPQYAPGQPVPTLGLYEKRVNEARGRYGGREPFLTLADITETLKYEKAIRIDYRNCHIGQLKLLLSEVQFLNRIVKKCDSIIVLYAGAAPGIHTYLLSQMFPMVKFVLVDPRPFTLVLRNIDGKSVTSRDEPSSDLIHLYTSQSAEYNGNRAKDGLSLTDWVDLINKGEQRIYIIEDLMTDEMAEVFSQLPNLAFVCDIRTVADSQDDKELHVVWNTAQQFVWVQLLKSKYNMLKYRQPYTSTNKLSIPTDKDNYMLDALEKAKKDYNIDFLAEWQEGRVKYFAGDLYMQAYAPIHSSEVRVVFDRVDDVLLTRSTHDVLLTRSTHDILSTRSAYNGYPLIQYDCKEHENKAFWLNKIIRSWVPFKNDDASASIGFDHCYDCALASVITRDYLDGAAKFTEYKGKPVYEMMNIFTKYTASLKKLRHGQMEEYIGEKH